MWEPIETYDKYKRPPKYAVFYFPSMKFHRWQQFPHREQIRTDRYLGERKCTKWMRLPDPSKD